jgi:phage gp37-like protein
MMPISITDIETAIVTRLALLNQRRIEHNLALDARNAQLLAEGKEIEQTPRAIEVRNISGYGGQLDTPEKVNQSLILAPAIWVTYDGESVETAGQNKRRTINIAVMVMATSYEITELRQGSAGAVGLYQLIDQVMEDLPNQNCGIRISPLTPVSVVPLWQGGPEGTGFSLAVVRFTTGFASPCEPDPSVVCDQPVIFLDFKMETIGADFKVETVYKTGE